MNCEILWIENTNRSVSRLYMSQKGCTIQTKSCNVVRPKGTSNQKDKAISFIIIKEIRIVKNFHSPENRSRSGNKAVINRTRIRTAKPSRIHPDSILGMSPIHDITNKAKRIQRAIKLIGTNPLYGGEDGLSGKVGGSVDFESETRFRRVEVMFIQETFRVFRYWHKTKPRLVTSLD